ncbi:MAG: N,N-dimethylformamidase beta subunit family domain-containing protein [Thermomicrobiales bacterium]
MKIVGYGDRWSVQPGETIRFLVSTELPSYQARIVRLIHGDTNPAGPGYKERPVASTIEGQYEGRAQAFHPGSFAVVPDTAALQPGEGLTLGAWIYPTTPRGHSQAILAKWEDASRAGYALVVDAEGALALWLGDGRGETAAVFTGEPLTPFTWYRVEASFDVATGRVHLRQESLGPPHIPATRSETEATVAVVPASAMAPFTIAAWTSGVVGQRVIGGGHFNGKIDAPEVRRNGDIVAAWDFARDFGSERITDVSPHALHGRTMNFPMRAVTGHNFTGRETSFLQAPKEYGAIFFHDDDLEDAGWEADFSWVIPDDLASGVYAVHLQAGDAEDHIPFFVRPRRGTSTAPIAVLLSSYTYLAYANEQITWRNPDSPVPHDPMQHLQPQDHYIVAHGLKSAYDHHADDTGVHFSSRLRPVLNSRPKYSAALILAPWQLNADLYLIDWLEAMGHAYDVITDEDLHAEGSELLASYRVVISSNHHEYWSGQMLDALETYLAGGGRLMSLTGNGYYWPIGIDPNRPHAIELRRGQNGTGTWRSAPGENWFQTTGEPGGLWRDRGRAPQRLVGVGMSAAGFDVALPFRRLPDSHDPRAAFIFEGVGDDEPIGDAGLMMGGGAGLEIDRADAALGTPAHALVVATANGFSNSYLRAIEEVTAPDAHQGGPENPAVRGDMVFFETPNDGAVFAVGSITWSGSLSHDDYQNPVSRITDNVLRAFASDRWPER